MINKPLFLGVVDVKIYEGSEREYFLGLLGTLAGCSTWMLTATKLYLPVSSSHSIVGSTIGFSVALRGFKGIDWTVVYRIVASWFISPAFSAFVSCTLYIILDLTVLRRDEPVEKGLFYLPFFFFIMIAFNIFSIVFQGSKREGFCLIQHLPMFSSPPGRHQLPHGSGNRLRTRSIYCIIGQVLLVP
jgi:sodium-dependent phosphate transporter